MFVLGKRQDVLLVFLLAIAVFCLHAALAHAEIPLDARIVPLGVPGTAYEGLQPGIGGGTLRLCTSENPTTWNDTLVKTTATSKFTNLMFDGLIEQDPITGVLSPKLAVSWEIADTVLIFHLREGVCWSDGTPFTADDVLFAYEEMHHMDEAVIAKPDDYTITATYPMLVSYSMLRAFLANIMPKHILLPFVQDGSLNDAWGLATNPAELVGIGPFIVASYEPDVQVTMRRNPYYYEYDRCGVQLPYFDTLVFAIAPDASEKLLSGEIDATGLTEMNIKAFESAPGITLILGDTVPGTTFTSLNLDAEDEQLRGLFRQVEFRRAVAHAMDKRRMLEEAQGGYGEAQWSFVNVQSPYYAGRETYGGTITETCAVTYDYDLAVAGRLLDQCGIADIGEDGIRQFADGTPVSFSLQTNEGNERRAMLARILVQDLRMLGLDVKVELISFSELVGSLMGRNSWDAIILGLSGSEHPSSAESSYRTTGRMHFWHVSAARGDTFPHERRIDELLDLGRLAAGPEKEFECYSEMQILQATDDLGLIFMVRPIFAYAIGDDIGNKEIISSRAVACSIPQVLYRTEP